MLKSHFYLIHFCQRFQTFALSMYPVLDQGKSLILLRYILAHFGRKFPLEVKTGVRIRWFRVEASELLIGRSWKDGIDGRGSHQYKEKGKRGSHLDMNKNY